MPSPISPPRSVACGLAAAMSQLVFIALDGHALGAHQQARAQTASSM